MWWPADLEHCSSAFRRRATSASFMAGIFPAPISLSRKRRDLVIAIPSIEAIPAHRDRVGETSGLLWEGAALHYQGAKLREARSELPRWLNFEDFRHGFPA